MTKGIKTSEFWTTIGTGVVVALNHKLGLNLDPSTILSLVVLAASWAMSRAHVKANATKAPDTVAVGSAGTVQAGGQ